MRTFSETWHGVYIILPNNRIGPRETWLSPCSIWRCCVTTAWRFEFIKVCTERYHCLMSTSLIICGATYIICGAFYIIFGAFHIICTVFLIICGTFVMICSAFVTIRGTFVIICSAFVFIWGAFVVVCGGFVIIWSDFYIICGALFVIIIRGAFVVYAVRSTMRWWFPGVWVRAFEKWNIRSV